MKASDGIALSAALLLGGCSIFPYDSHYLCEKTDDYGHCTSVQGAYKDAVSGGSDAAAEADQHEGKVSHAKPAGEDDGEAAAAPAPPASGHEHPRLMAVSMRDKYREAQYRAMAGMVDAPVAPVVVPAKVLRTLVPAYQDGSSLFMPRYVFYVVDQPHFVLGDYLSQDAPGSPAIYPNGGAPTRELVEPTPVSASVGAGGAASGSR